MSTFTLLCADLGLSRDFAATGNSVTMGPVNGYTMQYCAPEVAEREDRNKKSDIFSPGYVYIEIMAALKPISVSPSFSKGCFMKS